MSETPNSIGLGLNETSWNVLVDPGCAGYSDGRRAASKNLVAAGLLTGSVQVGLARTALGDAVVASKR